MLASASSTNFQQSEGVDSIYELLHGRDTNGNPLTFMMSRNLNFFSKLNIKMKHKITKELERWSTVKDTALLDPASNMQLENSFILAGFD